MIAGRARSVHGDSRNAQHRPPGRPWTSRRPAATSPPLPAAALAASPPAVDGRMRGTGCGGSLRRALAAERIIAMAENLVEMLQNSLTASFAGDAAKHLGESEMTTRSA